MYHEFTATGVSPWTKVKKDFNTDLYGDGVGTVILEKTYNGGTDLITVKTLTKNDPQVGLENDRMALYRFKCTARTSGTFKCRIK